MHSLEQDPTRGHGDEATVNLSFWQWAKNLHQLQTPTCGKAKN